MGHGPHRAAPADRGETRRRGMLLRAVIDPGADPSSIAALLGDRPPSGLADAAADHGIAGYAWRALRHQPALVGVERDELEARYHDGIASHLHALVALTHIGRALDGAGVRWVVVKGPVLAERVHDSFDLRFYGDVDVLVAPNDLEDALDALTTAGGVVLDRNWALLCREEPGELHVATEGGAIVDLHWHLLSERQPRNAFRWETEDLLDRAVTVDLNGIPVPTLSPEDTVVHLAAHTVLSGGDRLVWHQDLARALTVLDLDVARLARTARAAALADVVDAALTLVEHLAPAEPLAAIRDRLDASRVWRHAIRATARRQPIGANRPNAPSAARLVSRATRDSLSASLREASRRTLDRVARADARTPTGRVDPDGPAGIRHASGGPEARAAFLAAVAAQGRAALAGTRPSHEPSGNPR